MKQPFEQIGFFLELTKDGSPTLRLGKDIQSGESMHHSFGAAAETNYIYKSVISEALQSKLRQASLDEFKTAIVGLGLGYIEISWAQSLILNQQSPSDLVCFESFEVVPELRSSFRSWVEEAENNPLYDQISEKLQPQIEVSLVKKVLQQALARQSQLRGDILNEPLQQKWNVICYDAFSQKTSSPLWEESFLNRLLLENAHTDCVFTTYACTSLLKKVLIEHNFLFIKRPGFAGKRDSTIALRGAFKDDATIFRTF